MLLPYNLKWHSITDRLVAGVGQPIPLAPVDVPVLQTMRCMLGALALV
jgi:hypothetical protein